MLKDNNGLTLMEVLISVAILSISLIAVLKASLQIQDTLIKGQEKTLHSLLAVNKMAEVMAIGPEKWNTPYGQYEKYPEYSWEVSISSVNKHLLRTIIVTLVDTENKEPIKNIEKQIFQP